MTTKSVISHIFQNFSKEPLSPVYIIAVFLIIAHYIGIQKYETLEDVCDGSSWMDFIRQSLMHSNTPHLIYVVVIWLTLGGFADTIGASKFLFLVVLELLVTSFVMYHWAPQWFARRKPDTDDYPDCSLGFSGVVIAMSLFSIYIGATSLAVGLPSLLWSIFLFVPFITLGVITSQSLVAGAFAGLVTIISYAMIH